MQPFLVFSNSISPIERYILAELKKYIKDVSANSLMELFSPELFVIYNENDTIGIDEIREFLRFFYHKPGFERYKLGVIVDFKNVEEQAQNLLLKFLESLKEYMVVFLGATSEHAVLDTIKSRSRIIHLHYQQEMKNLPSKILDQIFDVAFCKRPDGIKDVDDLLGMMNLFKSRLPLSSYKAVLKVLTEVTKYRKAHISKKQLLDYLLLKFKVLGNEG